MGINYKDVVPWGRSFDEYVKMFSLSPEDLNSSILDCGGGPAGFNAEMTQQKLSVVSNVACPQEYILCSPLFNSPTDGIYSEFIVMLPGIYQ